MGYLGHVGSKYFEPLSEPCNRPTIGQIGWAPVPSLETNPYVLEAERETSASHGAARARWVPVTDAHFRTKTGAPLPVLGLKLAETEEVLCYKAKRRPVVIIANSSTEVAGMGKDARPHHQERRLVVAPIYDLKNEEDYNGFSSKLAIRIRHLAYRQFFPFAAWSERRDVIRPRSFREGVIRLDRLQFVLHGSGGFSLYPLRVARQTMAVLHSMLWSYLEGNLDADIADLIELFGLYLKELEAPSATDHI